MFWICVIIPDPVSSGPETKPTKVKMSIATQIVIKSQDRDLKSTEIKCNPKLDREQNANRRDRKHRLQVEFVSLDDFEGQPQLHSNVAIRAC